MNAELEFAKNHAVATMVSANFFRGLDSNDPDLAAVQFVADGVWHRKGVPLIGRDAIRAAIAARDPDRRTCHLVHNVIARPEGPDRITSQFYLLVYDAQGDAPAQMASILDCQDTIVRTADGWRIAEKSSRVHLSSTARK